MFALGMRHQKMREQEEKERQRAALLRKKQVLAAQQAQAVAHTKQQQQQQLGPEDPEKTTGVTGLTSLDPKVEMGQPRRASHGRPTHTTTANAVMTKNEQPHMPKKH